MEVLEIDFEFVEWVEYSRDFLSWAEENFTILLKTESPKILAPRKERDGKYCDEMA